MNTTTTRLIWIDLEMTGLDVSRESIIEIATVVTDAELNVLAEGPVIAAMNVGLQAARVDQETMVRDYLPALRAAAEEVGLAIGHARL